ncbi:unnamed protein product [Lupinus luteus]|uniref:Phosphofructokinase domain-containing protein n=1 Tax=Lupinus luteus TaxID=3873 RepID=A0AAV1WGB4_LUPLU
MDSDYGVHRELSHLQHIRTLYQPELPPSLQGTNVRVEFGDGTTVADPSDAPAVSHLFPNTYGQPLAHFLSATSEVTEAEVNVEHPALRVGVVFSGRQSPGGHNVIWGLHNALKIHNPHSVLLGFLGGSEGLFAQKTLEITDEILSTYKNQGGYDLLGRTKDQIRTEEQVNAALAASNSLKLDGLVIIGGVTSNTDAAYLAETFAAAKSPTKVVGVPVTLNGDLKNAFVETNVGFDTVSKVNSQLISNVCTDALSAEKYYYFIRLIGRKASHVALESALQSNPNLVILGEEVAASKLTLSDITKQISDAIQIRADQGKNHGVIILPEGLIESIPEVYALLKEIHSLLRQGVASDDISSQLSPWAFALFEFLPPFIRKQLLLNPESDDSSQLSQIETEKLLAYLVEEEINKRAAMLSVKHWSPSPGASLIGKPTIHPATVDLRGKAYELLRQNAVSLLLDDIYKNPGPLQFEGPGADAKPITLSVEDQDYIGGIKKLQEYIEQKPMTDQPHYAVLN